MSYELVEDRGVMDDKDLRHSEMMGVLRTEDDIRAGVVENVRKRFVCGGGCFRRYCRHCTVMSCKIKPILGTLYKYTSSSRSEEKAHRKRESNRASAKGGT